MSPDRSRPRDGNRMREMILAAVRADPGIHMSAVRRQLDIGWGTMSYHLRVLRRAGAMQVFTQGREARLFPAEVAPKHIRWLSALQDEVGSAILETLHERPDIGISDLNGELGHSRKILRRHLLRLDGDGIIQKKGHRRPRYQIVGEFGDFLRGRMAPTLTPGPEAPAFGMAADPRDA